MPIRPENKARYPKTWKAMVAAAAARSGGQCECDGKCGQDHAGGRCAAINGEPHPATGSKVVLTLAHEHGVPLEETSIDRMFHACQRCHNRYDAPMRRAGVLERIHASQAKLFNYTDEDERLVLEQIERVRARALQAGRHAPDRLTTPTESLPS